jgi:hypothetical protein
MRSVVITLSRTPERLDCFLEAWAALSVPLRLDVCFGADIPADPIRGCYESHRAALTIADGPTAIFEDDAVFAPDFEIPANWPDDADIFYLGGEHRGRTRHHSDGVVRCSTTLRTHAYIAARPAELAVRLEARRSGEHLDCVLNRIGLVAYAVDPFVVGQRAGPSLVRPRTGRSRDQYWNVKLPRMSSRSE